MSWLATFLVTKLAPSLSKTILKLWLQDNVIAQDVSKDLVGLLGQKTEDALARRKGARLFEDIGERVALSLQPHFKDFNKKQMQLAGRLAADTFNRAEITPELLVQQNLDPVELARHLEGHAKPAFGLNERAEALYKRIVKEGCQQIVDIASSLPGFTERSFAAVLAREEEIKTAVVKTLEEVEKLRGTISRQRPDVEEARFEADYRRAVARKLDSVEIFGVDVSRTNKQQKLSVAYISLSVEEDAKGQADGEEQRSQRGKLPEGEEDAITVVSVEKALARSARILIRGEAGSGKTTLLKWIAVQSAQGRFEAELDEWNGTTPFFIRLRQLPDGPLPAPEEFPHLVAPSIAHEMPKGWVHEKLRSGRGVVLVDGIDEVPQKKREKVRVWLGELANSFPKSRYLVTSRPHAIEEGWISAELFEEAELQPMDLPEISTFVERWHMAVRENLEGGDEIRALAGLEESLKEAVRDPSKPIRRLATSPLLCAMICAMHRDRREQLPEDRIELYEAACQMLLERRDIERGVHLRDYPRLKYRQKRLLLDDLAYWMIKNDLSEVNIGEVSDRFSRRLPNMSDVKEDIAGEDVVRFFVDRSGVVREPVKGRLDFAHRTFQEYMAARSALDEEDLGLLVKNAHNDQWREVIILAVGQATPKQRETLILELIKRGGREASRRHHLYLLAVACLEVTLELSPKVKAKVVERIKAIVPPRTFTEAKQLANAGDLAVPLLRYTPNLARTTAACVRTLALIGSESAVEALKGYAADKRESVRQELIKAGGISGPSSKYFERVLSNWSSIRVERPTGQMLESIMAMPKLEDLTVKEGSLRSLPLFDALPTLTALALTECGLLSLPDRLGRLKGLETLDLSRNDLASLPTSVGHLRNLGHLNLSGNALKGLPESFGGLTKLTDLDISANGLETLPTSFGRLKALRRLDLSVNFLRSLPTSFARLKDLEILALGHALTALPDFIGQLSKLEVLVLWGTRIAISGAFADMLSHPRWDDLHFRNSFGQEVRRLYKTNFLSMRRVQPGFEILDELVYWSERMIWPGRQAELLPRPPESERLQHLFEDMSVLAGTPEGKGRASEFLPPSFVELVNLRSLLIKENVLSHLPDSLCNLPHLQELTLLTPNLSALPESIGLLRSLRSLCLSSDEIASLPESLGDLESLETLTLHLPQLSSLPKAFRELQHLREFRAFSNDFWRRTPVSALPKNLKVLGLPGRLPRGVRSQIRKARPGCRIERARWPMPFAISAFSAPHLRFHWRALTRNLPYLAGQLGG